MNFLKKILGIDSTSSKREVLFAEKTETAESVISADDILTYKKEGSGLIIKSIDTTAKYTRVHTYDGSGRETKFSVDVNKDNLVFTASISFHY